MLGSALKNKGIQPLLAGIIDYLPNPEEKPPKNSILDPKMARNPSKSEKLLAYAYKIVNDKQKGALTYLRIYAGKIQHRTALMNVSRSMAERPHHIYRVRANQYVSTTNFIFLLLLNGIKPLLLLKDLTEVTAGDIAAVSGLKCQKIFFFLWQKFFFCPKKIFFFFSLQKNFFYFLNRNTQSGDTLIEKDDERFLLEEIEMPQPVFFAALEYEYARDKSRLEAALKDICREDSSLIVKEDIESGQILVSGLGELHLEVFSLLIP